MSKKQNLYTGRSAQLAVMAEFLRRGYNAAIPEIDIGEDIFVVRDADLSRIQVKGAVGKGTRIISGQFSVPLAQLRRLHEPELFYIFTVYHTGMWKEFVIIPRDRLATLHDVDGIGNESKNKLVLYFSFPGNNVVCSQTSLVPYWNNWGQWPIIQH